MPKVTTVYLNWIESMTIESMALTYAKGHNCLLQLDRKDGDILFLIIKTCGEDGSGKQFLGKVMNVSIDDYCDEHDSNYRSNTFFAVYCRFQLEDYVMN